MKQEKFSGYWGDGQRNVILLIIITLLIIYIAVPIYGVIQDARQGETVFVIEGSIPGEGKGLLDKIIDFVFKSKEIAVPAVHIVDLKGIVLYSDKTPYSNGIIELRSTPRYTRTAKDGSFLFRSVGAGEHKINVIDESGNILASCNVDISIDRKTSN
ncbi:MAG TPA: hypothetical protein VM577_02220, partial [Anaerovoracaceae bacterium]|nr:hypothetical protein [Anaerovoracaceae bacterium]